jgi:hypothetical protein
VNEYEVPSTGSDAVVFAITKLATPTDGMLVYKMQYFIGDFNTFEGVALVDQTFGDAIFRGVDNFRDGATQRARIECLSWSGDGYSNALSCQRFEEDQKFNSVIADVQSTWKLIDIGSDCPCVGALG